MDLQNISISHHSLPIQNIFQITWGQYPSPRQGYSVPGGRYPITGVPACPGQDWITPQPGQDLGNPPPQPEQDWGTSSRIQVRNGVPPSTQPGQDWGIPLARTGLSISPPPKARTGLGYPPPTPSHGLFTLAGAETRTGTGTRTGFVQHVSHCTGIRT